MNKYFPDLTSRQSVHVIGVGGAGMGAIAEVLLAMGHKVSGSDIKDSPRLDRLRAFGVKVSIGHAPENINEVDFIVRSSAISDSNIECQYAFQKNIDLLSREKILGGISRLKNTIAVSGTHGKTTTASMLSLMLREASFKPSFIIGGDVNEIGTGATWDEGQLFVVEADESDGSFLGLDRKLALVTNIEEDHLEFHGGFEGLFEVFLRFARETDGPVLLGIDDLNSFRLSKEIETVTVGTHLDADWHIEVLDESWAGSSFRILNGSKEFNLSLSVPGLHNIRNAAIASVAALELEAPIDSIQSSLKSFGGVARRFERQGKVNGITFVDDYAHLPSEVVNTLRAARSANCNRLVAVFQPHRYSRTESLGASFGPSFEGADLVVVTDIFPGGENMRPGISGLIVADAIELNSADIEVRYMPRREELLEFLISELSEGDLCLTMGAGDIASLIDEIKVRLLEEE